MIIQPVAEFIVKSMYYCRVMYSTPKIPYLRSLMSFVEMFSILSLLFLGDHVGNNTKSPNGEERNLDDLSDEEQVASEFLSRDQDTWEMADQNRDGELQEEEFLSFQHPEQNRKTVFIAMLCG